MFLNIISDKSGIFFVEQRATNWFSG